MANPFYATYDTTGVKDPWNSDWGLDHYQVTVGVWLSNAATYSVEGTLDDVSNPNVTPRWFALADFPVGSNTAKVVDLYTQFLFLRVNIAVLVGTLELKIVQGMRQR